MSIAYNGPSDGDLNDRRSSFRNTFTWGHDYAKHLLWNLDEKHLIHNFHMLGEKQKGINDFGE